MNESLVVLRLMADLSDDDNEIPVCPSSDKVVVLKTLISFFNLPSSEIETVDLSNTSWIGFSRGAFSASIKESTIWVVLRPLPTFKELR